VKKAESPEHESGDGRGMILPERRAGRAVRGAGRNQEVVRHLEYENRGVTVIGELARVSADCGTIPGWLNGCGTRVIFVLSLQEISRRKKSRSTEALRALMPNIRQATGEE